MFDNIIGQKNIITTLKTDITQSKLPPAMLFFGPPHSGKLSTGLETARVLSCEKKSAEWTCTCHSCVRHRLLLHPDLILLGYRDFSVEISACAHVFTQTKKISSKYLFIRSVRKLLKRFNPVLWDNENTQIKKVKSNLQEIEEFLDMLSAQKDFSHDFPHKQLKTVVDLCRKIAGDFKTENIPIDHIRKAIYWAHLSTSALRKIIIIDNADKMLDSSRNSILKLLEEPPKNVYIILLTQRKGALIKTILSRLRPYHFYNRSHEETKEILKKIFKDDTNEFDSLRDFFLSWKNLNPTVLKSLSMKFIEMILADNIQEPDIPQAMSELFSFGSAKTAIISFAEELTHILGKVLHKTHFEHIGFEQVETWAHILQQTMREFELFNLNPKNVIESLYFKMRAVV